jgi:hypothetical protein
LAAFAHFDGSHASVTAPDSVGGYWKLDRASAKLHAGLNLGRFNATNDAAANMGPHNGAMIWRTLKDGEESWHNAYFDEEDIRQATRKIHAQNPIVGRGIVLVNTPLAFSMLRAVDLLQVYSENQLSPQASREFSAGKTALRHLVPKL